MTGTTELIPISCTLETVRQARKRCGQCQALKGAKQIKAAEAAGFQKTESLHSLRVEGSDKAGMGAKLTRALAEAGINLRGLSAAALGKRYVTHLALDTAQDAAKAAAVLKKLS